MKVALLTYHAAYNFGSVLQAYATQESIKKLGYKVEIINYRMPSQRLFYGLFIPGMGLRILIRNLLRIATLHKRIVRERKYESLIESIFSLTKEVSEPEELLQFKNEYDIFVSGSDQIWNRFSNELSCTDWRKYIAPYLLEFTNKKKISYASSINTMADEDLALIKNSLMMFAHISSREENSAYRLSSMLNKKIETVLDPTFLLTGDTWRSFNDGWINVYSKKKYILFYELCGTKVFNSDLNKLITIAKKEKLQIVAIAPLAFQYPHINVINANEADVRDFLGLLDQAEFVVTNSYHGTVLSCNLEKNVYSLQIADSNDGRIEQVTKKIGISNCIIHDINEIDLNNKIDYDNVRNKIDLYRNKSLMYLTNALLS